MKCHIFFTVILALIASSLTNDEPEPEGARLLIAKHINNKYLVENMDVVVKYTVYNVGNEAALDVAITDNSFPVDSFVHVSGELNAKIDRVPPQSNVSHTVIVKPKKFGYFNFTSAEVVYRYREDALNLQSAVSSEPGLAYFISFREFDKKFSSHVIDWAAFAVMTLPCLAIPFGLWFSSKRKYEKLSKSLRKH